MTTHRSKYSPAARLLAIIVLMVLVAPSLTALVDNDDCCDELTCCDYVSCDCNCHAVAGLVSIPEYSHVINMTSYVGAATATLPTEDHPRRTDHPPRLSA